MPELRPGLLIDRIAAAFCTGLGLLVLIGWYSHNSLLLRISPAFVAMAYNTALGFFLGGLSLLTVSASEKWARALSLIGGMYCLLVGLLTLSEYFFGINLRIDELLMHPYVWSGVTAPGRMAFCSALCFSLGGFALLLAQSRRFALRPLLTAVFGSVIVGLGTIALSGYFSGIVQSYTWGALTRMAVHTAAGFVVLGAGLLALSWRDDLAWRREHTIASGTPGWLPVFVGIMAATVTLCLWQALVVEESASLALIRQLAGASHESRVLTAISAQSLIPAGALTGGLLLSLLLAEAVFLAQTARQQASALRRVRDELEQRVAERTEALAQANEALQELAVWQRSFLRDALASVTDGKLQLCSTADHLPPPRKQQHGGAIPLTPLGGLRNLRCQTTDAAAAARFSDERLHDLVTAVNEAGMNAIVHAGEGMAVISGDPSGTIQVRVEDAGQGITLENLPRAALSRGFTTAGTLGHGLKMMLQAADRLWLLTGPAGTTVVLEQDQTVPEPAWA